MHALGGYVLQKAPQEFVCRQRHRLALLVSVVTVAEAHLLGRARDNRLVAECCAMPVRVVLATG